MAARNDALLVAQHDMPLMRSPRSKEGQKSAVNPLDMGPLAVARSYRFLVEGVSHGGFRVVQQTARWKRKGDFARRPIFAGVFDALDKTQVGVARRRRMIGCIEAKKCPARRVAGR